METTELLRWILIFPIAGAILNGIILRNKNATLSGVIGTLAAVASFVVSVIAVKTYGSGHALDQWFTWFEAGKLKVPFHLEYTALSGIMLLVVTGVGSLIHMYAIGYMSHDESPWRFFCYLNLFLAAMLVLVLSAGLVGIFLGWEGVGLCSYLLIGYWYKGADNVTAGRKAFIANRIGDLGFFVALFVVAQYVGSFEIRDLLAAFQGGQIPSWVWMVMCGGLFWASTGKSAQIPLYVWLPDAMAGPTPVSALIHAATMVTSGVYLTTKLWPIYASQPEILSVMMWIGIGTAFLAALIAFRQRDIKKVLAYSTVSQLGFMFAALGAGAPVAAFFHVVTHACFKALLFLGAGSVIHGMHEKQDLYEMGHLKSHMKLTHLTFLIANLAIIGFPLTSGFFSKDAILMNVAEHSTIAFVLLIGAALLTAFYMTRCYTLAFHGEARSKEAEHAHESPLVMTLPLMVLAGLSVFVGWFETPGFLGGLHSFTDWVRSSWHGALEIHPHHAPLGEELLKVFVITGLSLAVAWMSFKKFSQFKKGSKEADSAFARASENKFWVDEAYEIVFIKPLSWFAEKSSWLIDTIFINGILHASRDIVKFSGAALSLFHTGNLQTYAVYLVAGTLLLLSLIKWVV